MAERGQKQIQEEVILLKGLKGMKGLKLVIALLLITVAISSAYLTYTSLSPKKKVISVPETVATLKTSYSGYALVTEKNPVWKTGEKLKGLPVYVTTASPIFNVTFSAEIGNSAAGLKVNRLDVNTEVIYFSKYGDGIVWSKEYTSNSSSVKLSRAKTEVSVDVSDVQSRIISIEKELGYRGKTGIEVISTVNYELSCNGKVLKGVKKYTLPITLDANTYSVKSEKTGESSIIVKKEKEITVRPSVEEASLPVAVLAASVAGLCVLAFTATNRSRGYSKYRNLISRGNIRDFSGNVVDLETFEDLLGVAMDTGERIIQSENAFFVIHGNTAYVFRDVNS